MTANIDTTEIEKFEAAAAQWWDEKGAFRALHDINGTRVAYIHRAAALRGRRVLDVGCGGGLLSESMAALGARVTGIDMGEKPLAVARAHLRKAGLHVDYRRTTVEAFARREPAGFDVVTCMEMLEHVPDPCSVVRACSLAVRNGGHVFFATLNRNILSFLLAIVAAERLLGLVPRGTHRHDRFVKPSELERWAVGSGLVLQDLSGLFYAPFLRWCAIVKNTRVNYLAHFNKTGHGP